MNRLNKRIRWTSYTITCVAQFFHKNIKYFCLFLSQNIKI
jgi:hypothetical protein